MGTYQATRDPVFWVIMIVWLTVIVALFCLARRK